MFVHQHTSTQHTPSPHLQHEKTQSHLSSPAPALYRIFLHPSPFRPFILRRLLRLHPHLRPRQWRREQRDETVTFLLRLPSPSSISSAHMAVLRAAMLPVSSAHVTTSRIVSPAHLPDHHDASSTSWKRLFRPPHEPQRSDSHRTEVREEYFSNSLRIRIPSVSAMTLL